MQAQSDHVYNYDDNVIRTVKVCVERARMCSRLMVQRSKLPNFSIARPVYELREYRDQWMREARSIKCNDENWQVLEIRLTHKYVGTYKHLDDWQTVGIMRIAASSKIENEGDEEDMCEPVTHEHFIKVRHYRDNRPTPNQISEALFSKFTSHGCAHEHDCCGCRSYHASTAQQLGQGYWRVVVTSSRNY